MKVKERELAQLCLTLCYPMDCSPPGFSYSWNFPGKSTGVGWHFLLQGMFLAQGSNLGLLHWRQMLLPSEPPGKPNKAKSFCKELVQLGLTLPFKKIPLLLKKKKLLMWCITLIDLRILKNPCIPGIKPTWSWCMIFLICCWILFARILLRIFASMFISDIGL